MNPKMDQWRTSPDAGQKKRIGERLESNCAVRKLLFLIYKSSVY